MSATAARRALPPALRSACAELGALPEVASAARAFASGDHRAALPLLERAFQVVEHVPSPPLVLAAHGALAQALRASGGAAREAALWRKLAASPSADAAVRLHALEGAAASELHAGDGGAAAELCAAAAALAPADAPGAAAALRVHASVAEALRAPDAAAAALEACAAEVEDDAAAAGSALLLLGDAHLADGGDRHVEIWERIVAADGDASDDGAVARAVAARCRLGAALLASGDAEAARVHLKAAVSAAEALDGRAKPYLGRSLALLAGTFAATGEPLAAEGLFRSSVDALAESGGGGGAPSAAHAQLLLPSLHEFADFVRLVEWNGVARTADADRLVAQADDLRSLYAEVLPPPDAPRGAGGRPPWSGLELWYSLSLSPDWLRECAAGSS